MAKEQSNIRERNRIDIGCPRKYTVVLHNDDFTTMDFVVKLLKVVFYKSAAEAVAIMLDVHKNGKRNVGEYSYDMALTKRDRAVAMAREEGFPLKITVQPVE